MSEKPRLAEVWVLGGGPAELAAALELAEVGLAVTVAAGEESLAAWEELPSEGVPDPDGSLRELIAHVAAPISPGGPAVDDLDAVAEPVAAVQIRASNGVWAPQPGPAVLGIPAVPMSKEALAVLGSGAGVRAYLDRVKPLLTIGKTTGLGALVRSRMGQGALDLLVEPVVRERFGVGADRVDAAVAAPGLNEELTIAGSLSGAVLAYSERSVARETRVRPAGGWLALRAAIMERLGLYAVEFTGNALEAVRRDVDGWVIVEAGGQEHAVSAVVAGVTSASLELPGLGEDLSELASASERVHACAQILDPGVPDHEGGDPRDALQLVEVPGGGTWSLRLRRRAISAGQAPAAWTAFLSGPAVPAGASGNGRGAIDEDRGVALAALAAAGLELADPSIETRRRTAPFATVQDRDSAVAKLAVWRASRDDVLPVGTALHGGALPEAIADARAAAVLLRRRLTGIAE